MLNFTLSLVLIQFVHYQRGSLLRNSLDEVHFIGATRPDGSSAIDETLAILGPKAREKIHLMEVPEMKLSATYLRERLRSGKTVRYMLPKCGWNILRNTIFMGRNKGMLSFDEIQLRVSQWLSKKRFKHTLML